MHHWARCVNVVELGAEVSGVGAEAPRGRDAARLDLAFSVWGCG